MDDRAEHNLLQKRIEHGEFGHEMSNGEVRLSGVVQKPQAVEATWRSYISLDKEWC